METFLWHILHNYENLPEYLIFTQGNPFQHMFDDITPENFSSSLRRLLSTRPRHSICLFNFMFKEHHGPWYAPSLKTREYFSLLFDAPVPNEMFFPIGAQIVVPRESILSKPKQFYAHVHSLLLHEKQSTVSEAGAGSYSFDAWSMNGWTLERLWAYLFDEATLPSSSFCRKRYLVIGGAGVVGRHIVNALQESNTVIAIDKFPTGDNYHNLPHRNVLFIKVDKLNEDEVYLAGVVDGIFHVEGMDSLISSILNPGVQNIIEGAAVIDTKILKYASEHTPPVKVIYSSTSTYLGLTPASYRD